MIDDFSWKVRKACSNIIYAIMKYDDYATLLGFQKIKNVYILNKEGYSIYLRDWQYMVLNIPEYKSEYM